MSITIPRALLLVTLLAQRSSAFTLLSPKRVAPRASPSMSAQPPDGFVWSEVPELQIQNAPTAPTAEATPPAAPAPPVEASVPAASASPAAAVGRSPTQNAQGVVTPTQRAPAVVKPTRKPSSQGIFAPIVRGAKGVMGDKELNKLRGDVIAQHSAVISAFVDTSESKFGQLMLKRMFEAADKDGNGTLDKEEVRAALQALGFDFLEEKQVSGIMQRADDDDNEVIDFEEFVKEAPRTLRTNLIKLAKKNGHDLGFLA